MSNDAFATYTDPADPKVAPLTRCTVGIRYVDGTASILQFASPADSNGVYGEVIQVSYRDVAGKWSRRWE